MRMTRCFALFVSFLVLAPAAVAGAPTAAATASATPKAAGWEKHPWSFTTGLRLFSPLLISGGDGIGVLGGGSPLVSVGFERRVADGIGVTFSLGSSFGQMSSSLGAFSSSSSFDINADVGARVEVIRTDRIVGSILADVGVGYFRGTSEWGTDGGASEQTHFDSLSVSASAGLALDIRLVDQLFLRLETPLLRVSYAQQFSDADVLGDGSTSTSESVSAGLVLAPRLALRLDF